MGVEGIGNAKVIPIEWLRALRGADPPEMTAPRRPADPAGQSGSGAVSAGADDADPAVAPLDRERLAAELMQELEKLPDVRRDKVVEAKLRISTGYYERDEVRREILRSVLASILPSREPAGDDGASS